MTSNTGSFTRSLRQIKDNLFTALSSTVLVGVIGLVTLAINTRALKVADVGVIAAVQAYALLISGLLTLSTHLPLMRLGTEAIEQGREDDLQSLVRYALLLDGAAGLAAATITILCATVAGPLLGINSAIRAGLAIFAIPMLFTGLASANGILRLVDRFDLLRRVEVIGALLLLIAVVVLGLLGAPLRDYLIAYALVFGLTFLARYLVARVALARRFAEAGPGRPLAPELKRDFLGFAASSSLGSTIDTLRTNVDTIVVIAMFGKEGAGIYGVAKQASGAVRKFASFSSLVSFVEFSRMTARGEFAERSRLFFHVLRICAAIGVSAVAAALLLGRPALAYGFGEDYVAGYWAFVVLVVAAALQFLMNPTSMLVQIIRGGMPAMMCNLAGLVAFAILVVPLGHAFGFAGVALGSVAYFLVSMLAGAWLIRGKSRAAAPTEPVGSID